MTQVDAQDVIDRLSREVGALTVRLAVAEARAEQAERALVDKAAAEEGRDVD